MKHRLDPFEARPFMVEYYTQLIHRNPARRGYAATRENAEAAALAHLVRRHYVKAVIVKRESGRVIGTRLHIGLHMIWQAGQQANEKVVIEVPEME